MQPLRLTRIRESIRIFRWFEGYKRHPMSHNNKRTRQYEQKLNSLHQIPSYPHLQKKSPSIFGRFCTLISRLTCRKHVSWTLHGSQNKMDTGWFLYKNMSGFSVILTANNVTDISYKPYYPLEKFLEDQFPEKENFGGWFGERNHPDMGRLKDYDL